VVKEKTMENLWAPWRINLFKQPLTTGCFFCQYLREDRDQENLILERGERCFVIMNRYPYTNGHLMVVPYQHVGQLAEVECATRAALMDFAVRWQAILVQVIHAHGFNLGINLGKAAGAGVDDHLHLHIVPRWIGDANFMSTLADMRVINQSLNELYQELRMLAAQKSIESNDKKGSAQNA
jgi:ATP adenylyltransferase